MEFSHSMYVGDIAAAVGVSADTIRYYEKLDLLPKACRSHNGFRIFPPEAVERVRFVKQAQEMGFSLDEIKQLLAIKKSEHECRTVHDLLLLKLHELDVKLEQINHFRTVLKHRVAECEKELAIHGDECACPVLAPLEKGK